MAYGWNGTIQRGKNKYDFVDKDMRQVEAMIRAKNASTNLVQSPLLANGKAGVTLPLESAPKRLMRSQESQTYEVRRNDYGLPTPECSGSEDEIVDSEVPGVELDGNHMVVISKADILAITHHFDEITLRQAEVSNILRSYAVGYSGNKIRFPTRVEKKEQAAKETAPANLKKLQLAEQKRKEKEEKDEERNTKRDLGSAGGKWLCHICDEGEFTDEPYPQDDSQTYCAECFHPHQGCKPCHNEERLKKYFREKREEKERVSRAARAARE
ncbi:hypothetical protein VTL71DRAFT_9275 [Oculimacula yallundae]|uniref:Uncharacterized protein n=1 Tax=Oculimacula yallundae TaxID=86028 RepID=A0ABR4BUA9_9HELO